MSSGLFLPFSAISTFSPAVQAELTKFVEAQIAVAGVHPVQGVALDEEEDEDPSDLSVAQAKKFLDRVSDKVRTTVRTIAEADAAGFEVRSVTQALNVDDDTDLRGVWGGITKRTRTVLGDDEAYLIWWTERDDSWVGRVSETTHRAFRKVLGL